MHRADPPGARISANAGVVQQRRRRWLKPKSLKINEGCNAGVAGGALQNRGLQVRFLPGLLPLKGDFKQRASMPVGESLPATSEGQRRGTASRGRTPGA